MAILVSFVVLLSFAFVIFAFGIVVGMEIARQNNRKDKEEP